ncbi:MAG: putrescine export ABC transporter permease SapB [Sodalis sp. (in: enterobacteria)]
MIIFTLRRLVLLFVALLLLTLVSFSLNYCIPGAPLGGALLLDAYRYYFWKLIHGSFGVSSINGLSISLQLIEVFPATIELCLLAFFLALLVGIPLGIIAGVARGKWQDISISIFALLGLSMPVFCLGLLLTLYFSLHLGWFPVAGRIDLLYTVQRITGFGLIDAWLSNSPCRSEMISSALKHMVLPIAAMAVAPTTEVVRMMRLSTIEVIDCNYIRAAATRGLSCWTIVRRHLLHNALPPIIPQLGIQFSTMLTLAMITEVVFSLPGLGYWLISAIRQKDYTAISAGVMLLGTLVISVNVLADMLGALANPLRYKEWHALR